MKVFLIILLLLSSYLLETIEGYILLKNALIYTLVSDDDDDEMTSSSWTTPQEAILINDLNGLIERVGSNEDVMNAIVAPNSTAVFDMEGRTILPGFQDAHLHAVEAGINEKLCLFDEDAPISEYALYFEVNEQWCPTGGEFGDKGWLMGAGVDIGILQETLENNPNQDYPITVLDREFPSTPVCILDAIGHGAVANTAAMKAVGYDKMTADPPGGVLVRDPETGDLTGIVLENAQQPFRDAAFPTTTANNNSAYRSLLDALAKLNSYGITSVSDAGGFWRQAQTESWERAESEGKMTVRASNALYIYPDQPFDEQLPELMKRFSNDSRKLVRFNQAKIYVDGILSLATGAVLEPYEAALELPAEEELGFEYFGDDDSSSSSSRLNNISSILADRGFQLHMHVTGDRGARLALDAIQGSNSAPGPHRLTHLYLVDPSDRGRFAEQNVVADFQAAPSSVSRDYVDYMKGIIGKDRAAELVPLAELYDAGATIVLSSDWDADTLSPLRKIQTVLTRPDGRNLPNVETVIPMLTKNVATLLKTNTGVLETGKLADLVVLDQDIFNIPVNQIAKTKAVVTIFNGKVVFDPDGIMGEPMGTFPNDDSSGMIALSPSSLSLFLGMCITLTAVLLL